MIKTKSLVVYAMLISTALALSYFERFLPLGMLIPLPGVKLGLANIVTMFAVYFLGNRPALIILMIRVFLGALLGGGPTALMFSAVGGIFSYCVLCLLKNSLFFSLYGVGIACAAAHNIGQMLVCALILGPMSLSYLPSLLIAALVTGSSTAALAIPLFNRFSNISLAKRN